MSCIYCWTHSVADEELDCWLPMADVLYLLLSSGCLVSCIICLICYLFNCSIVYIHVYAFAVLFIAVVLFFVYFSALHMSLAAFSVLYF